MKAVIAIDSFKGSMSSMEAGNAAAEGIRRVLPDAEVRVCPLADGGEGTVEALVLGLGGTLHTVRVTGPLGQPVDCRYGIVEEQGLGVIEMAGAAGITLTSAGDRNPLYATTFGVGEVIRDAIGKGCRRFLVGIGGSATNDGGLGMLQALGYEFTCSDGKEAPRGAVGLRDIVKVSGGHVIPELKECTFRVACDVTSPLCGTQGASAVYGPQKGATPDMVEQMDCWLYHFAEITCDWKRDSTVHADIPGTGAAGGLGFAFLAYTDATLESGIQIVLEETRLEEQIRQADLVITGEGRLDGQTVMGKAPAGVAGLAKKYGIKVIAFSGCVTPQARACNEAGIDAYFPILRTVTTLEEAMEPVNAQENMKDTVEQVMRLIAVSRNK